MISVGAGSANQGHPPPAVVNPHLLCCPQSGCPGALAGTGAGRCFQGCPASPGLTLDLHQLPMEGDRNRHRVSLLLCIPISVCARWFLFTSPVEDFHENTNHPSLFNYYNRGLLVLYSFPSKALRKDPFLMFISDCHFSGWCCYKSFWPKAALPVTWGSQSFQFLPHSPDLYVI